MFAGTFAHTAGSSGSFKVRKRGGELLVLSVLGSTEGVTGVPEDPASVDCPVIIHGLPDWEIICEHRSMMGPTRLDLQDIRRAGSPNEYVGHLVDHRGPVGTQPPALAVFTALLLVDAFLIRRHYLAGPNS